MWGMVEKLLIEKPKQERMGYCRPLGTFYLALQKPLAVQDSERQRRIELYTQRAAQGLPLFSPQ